MSLPLSKDVLRNKAGGGQSHPSPRSGSELKAPLYPFTKRCPNSHYKVFFSQWTEPSLLKSTLLIKNAVYLLKSVHFFNEKNSTFSQKTVLSSVWKAFFFIIRCLFYLLKSVRFSTRCPFFKLLAVKNPYNILWPLCDHDQTSNYNELNYNKMLR